VVEDLPEILPGVARTVGGNLLRRADRDLHGLLPPVTATLRRR
jgi:hypothetical protein